MDNSQNSYADKIKAIKLRLQKQVKEKEDQRNLIDSVWGDNCNPEHDLLSFLTQNLKK